jgi:hypothetical protein
MRFVVEATIIGDGLPGVLGAPSSHSVFSASVVLRGAKRYKLTLLLEAA